MPYEKQPQARLKDQEAKDVLCPATHARIFELKLEPCGISEVSSLIVREVS